VLDLLRGVRDVGMRAAMSLPVAPLNAVRDNYLASDRHRILSAYHDDWELPENQIDDRRFALRRRLCEGANAIWAKPVRTWEDRIERAAMAVHWNQISKVVPFPDDSIAGDPNRNFDWRALAHVVRGVLDLAGLKFGDYGRLASARATERPAGKALCCCVSPPPVPHHGGRSGSDRPQQSAQQDVRARSCWMLQLSGGLSSRSIPSPLTCRLSGSCRR
jgi:hypothetical protein